MRYAMGAHGGSVYLVTLAQTRSEHDAQDVAQDVFCRLLTDATAFTSDEHLRAWLLRVTVNRCCELHRMPWRRRVDALDEPLHHHGAGRVGHAALGRPVTCDGPPNDTKGLSLCLLRALNEVAHEGHHHILLVRVGFRDEQGNGNERAVINDLLACRGEEGAAAVKEIQEDRCRNALVAI